MLFPSWRKGLFLQVLLACWCRWLRSQRADSFQLEANKLFRWTSFRNLVGGGNALKLINEGREIPTEFHYRELVAGFPSLKLRDVLFKRMIVEASPPQHSANYSIQITL